MPNGIDTNTVIATVVYMHRRGNASDVIGRVVGLDEGTVRLIVDVANDIVTLPMTDPSLGWDGRGKQ